MKLPSTKNILQKKKMLIAGGIVLVVAGLGVGGWWFASQQATASYKAQLATSTAAITEDLNQSAEFFKSLAAAPEITKRMTQLAQMSDDLTKRANGLPALPAILGIGLTPKQDQQKREDLINALKQLSADAQQSHDLLAYESAVIQNLREVSDLSGKNATEQQGLAEAWQRFISNVSTLTPPAAAKNAHDQLLASAAAAQVSLSALPDLYNKKNYDGFESKRKEVESRFSDLRKLAEAIAVINQTHDKYITRDYASLLEALSQTK